MPLGLLTLLEELTNVVPSKRPSIQKVVQKSTTLYVSHASGTSSDAKLKCFRWILQTQATAQSTSVNEQGALVPVKHFLPTLRNPWRASKDGQGTVESKLQAIAAQDSGPVSLGSVISALVAIPRAKRMTGAIGLFKVSPLYFLQRIVSNKRRRCYIALHASTTYAFRFASAIHPLRSDPAHICGSASREPDAFLRP